MRRILLVLAVALAAAGAAGADTFRVVPADGDRTAASAWTPNGASALSLPYGFLTPPAQPEQRTLAQLQQLWQRAGEAYGIPWQVLAAINKVESNFGQNMGPSSAGAIGWMQFMPSTWLRWGTDGSGDGIADPWNPEDAVYSAARYLAAAGGATDLRRAVFAYNHADWYVNEVLQIAQVYGGGAQVTADLEALQQQVDGASASVEQARAALAAAEAEAARLRSAEAILAGRGAQARLLSDRLTFQQAAGQVGDRRSAADALVEQRREELDRAQTALAGAREQAQSASFTAGARTLLSGATYDSTGWVFPVGGGPGAVSVAHDHHDYPAADIAAPEGAPVYALNAAVVTDVWQGDAKCGTGLDLQTADGRTWTYCHLSYVDPAILPGTPVSAGAQVGLVGSTGDASGPHLHLQLRPASSYPQAEPWFRSFAGTAFTWQDEAPPPAAEHPVFAVLPGDAQAPAGVPALTSGGGFGGPATAGGGVVLFSANGG